MIKCVLSMASTLIVLNQLKLRKNCFKVTIRYGKTEEQLNEILTCSCVFPCSVCELSSEHMHSTPDDLVVLLRGGGAGEHLLSQIYQWGSTAPPASHRHYFICTEQPKTHKRVLFMLAVRN